MLKNCFMLFAQLPVNVLLRMLISIFFAACSVSCDAFFDFFMAADIPSSHWQTISINVTDGPTLSGSYLPSNMSQGDTEVPTIMIVHGLYDNSKRSRLVGEALQKKYPCHLFTLDLRGHGASDRLWWSTYGATESADVYAAVQALRQLLNQRQPVASSTTLILLGISMGAVAILKAIHDHPDIAPAGIIVDSPFCDLDDVRKNLVTTYLPPWLARTIDDPSRQFLDWLKGTHLSQLKPIVYLDALHAPLCILHCLHDPITPCAHAHMLHARALEREVYTELHVVDVAGHVALTHLSHREYFEHIIPFIEHCQNYSRMI